MIILIGLFFVCGFIAGGVVVHMAHKDDMAREREKTRYYRNKAIDYGQRLEEMAEKN